MLYQKLKTPKEKKEFKKDIVKLNEELAPHIKLNRKKYRKYYDS